MSLFTLQEVQQLLGSSPSPADSHKGRGEELGADPDAFSRLGKSEELDCLNTSPFVGERYSATGARSLPITSISIDSRTLQPGALFIAISGVNHEGHDYVQTAAEKGAVAVVVSKPVDTTVPVITVGDTVKALGQLGAYHRAKYPNLPIIAVTGSCGKTTTKEMLSSILAQQAPVLSNRGTLNNEFGVPLTLLELTHQHSFAVIEMGANHHHEIAYLTALTRPQVAIITNAGPVHLEGFGDVEGVARGKGEIFGGLLPQGTAILNRDDKAFSYWQQITADKPQLTFGLDPEAHVRATDIVIDEAGRSHFHLHIIKESVRVKLNMLGRHHILNALAAAAGCAALHIPIETIKAGLEQVAPVPMRMMKRAGLNGAAIIDDCYNANPNALKAALEVLTSLPGEKVLVFADMAELGDHEEQYHVEAGLAAKRSGVQALYAMGDLSRFTVDAFGDGGCHFTSPEALIKALSQKLHAGMTVLVKGSRAQRLERVVKALVVHE